ncbi:hypothetical protein T439DRAFT_324259 [Meredithblackwellia eburnea MCA 4105]
MSSITASIDPALIVPIIILSIPVLYLPYSLYKNYQKKQQLKEQGIGRGVPGFLTSVKRVQIPPELAARIRAGEDVSAEEVTEALEAEKKRLEAEEKAKEDQVKIPDNVDRDWLPEGTLGSAKKGGAGGRRRKK